MLEASYLQTLPNENDDRFQITAVSQGITRNPKTSNRTQTFNWAWSCWAFEPYCIDQEHTQIPQQQQVSYYLRFRVTRKVENYIIIKRYSYFDITDSVHILCKSCGNYYMLSCIGRVQLY